MSETSNSRADVKRRIDTMIEKGFTILVGDATRGQSSSGLPR
jgi:hypothetical protein